MRTKLRMASLSIATAMTAVLPALSAETAQDFVTKAAIGGMFEVQSSKVAQDKLQDPTLKDFAQRMISDHGTANAKLESIAGEQKLQVPADLDAAHKSDVDKLQSAAAPVDATYADMQKTAHADAVSMFESYARDGDNSALKSFASETLPTLSGDGWQGRGCRSCPRQFRASRVRCGRHKFCGTGAWRQQLHRGPGQERHREGGLLGRLRPDEG